MHIYQPFNMDHMYIPYPMKLAYCYNQHKLLKPLSHAVSLGVFSGHPMSLDETPSSVTETVLKVAKMVPPLPVFPKQLFIVPPSKPKVS